MQRGSEEEFKEHVRLFLNSPSVKNPAKSYRMLFSEGLLLSDLYREDLKNLVNISFFTSKGIPNSGKFFDLLVHQVLPHFNEKNLFLFCEHIFSLEIQTKEGDGACRNAGFAKSLLKAEYEKYKKNAYKQNEVFARHACNHLQIFSQTAKNIKIDPVICLANVIAFNIMPALNNTPKKFDPTHPERNNTLKQQITKEREIRQKYWIGQIQNHDSQRPLRLSESCDQVTCADIRAFIEAYAIDKAKAPLGGRSSNRTKELLANLQEQLVKENSEISLAEIEKANTSLIIDFVKEVGESNPESRALRLIRALFSKKIPELSKRELQLAKSNLEKSHMPELKKALACRRRNALFTSAPVQTTAPAMPSRLGDSSPVMTRRDKEKGKEIVNAGWSLPGRRCAGNNS